jgi:hypothetical protein
VTVSPLVLAALVFAGSMAAAANPGSPSDADPATIKAGVESKTGVDVCKRLDWC